VQYCHPAGTYFRWHNLAVALQMHGHTVDVFAGDLDYKGKKRIEVRDGITYYIVPSLPSNRIIDSVSDPFSAAKRCLFLPKEKYDVYHLFQPFMGAYFSWNLLRLKNKKALFLYDWDDLWVDGLMKKGTTWRQQYNYNVTAHYEKNIPLKSDGVTVCSSFLKDRLQSNVSSRVIYNGFWKKEVGSKNGLRGKWKLNADTFYLAYIGKTADELDWIMEGFRLLKQNIQRPIALVICGPQKYAIEKYAIKEDEGIIYLGEVKPNEAAEIATAVDLGLIPLEDSPFNQSRFPIKFFDFLTVGTPIYMSNVGEIAKIADELTGVIKGSNKKEEWMQGLQDAVKKVEAGMLVKTEVLEERFLWQSIAMQMASYYGKLQTTK
jgi:glycosyltransferase involved in cell wall biosynthesis